MRNLTRSKIFAQRGLSAVSKLRRFASRKERTLSVMIEEKEYTTGSDGIKIIRKRTEAETQVNKRKIAGLTHVRSCLSICSNLNLF